MKVTVCFGAVRVVVPCGDGELLVKDLTRQAIHRYKKAVGKCETTTTGTGGGATSGGNIVVHSLQSADGGILDPDDRLNDVADDREHLVAAFDDGVVVHHHIGVVHHLDAVGHHHHQHQHHAGDGASNSSRGTPSPDHQLNLHYAPPPNHVQVGSGPGEGDHKTVTVAGSAIEVTLGDLDQLTNSTLQVRRGSEPALNHLQDTAVGNGGGRAANSNSNAKRWSAAPVITESKHNNLHKEDRERALSNGHSTDKWREMDEEEEEEEEDDDDEEEELMGGRVGGGGGGGSRRRNGWMRGGGGGHLAPAPFARDGTNRLSMQFLGDSPTGLRWADAADKASRVHSLSLPREGRMRKEPLGQATQPAENDNPERTELICLATDSGALGIHVVPEYDWRGGERGLVVQAVEEGGRVHRDGRLHTGDRITNINGRSLIGQPFHVVQDIFRESLRSSELRLRVVKQGSNMTAAAQLGAAAAAAGKKPPPPVYPKPPPPGGGVRGGIGTNGNSSSNKENQASGIGAGRVVSNGSSIGGIGGGGPPKEKAVGGIGSSNKENHLQQQEQLQQQQVRMRKHPSVGVGGGVGALQTGNTRRIGRKMEVQLVKGVHGLGFSITTRDNPAGGNCPIYIKNILPKGAAVEDGRLRPGDRLLAVDGVELTGKTQAEAVALLRQVPANQPCTICVSRHDVTHTNNNNNGNNTSDSAAASTSMEVASTSASPIKQRPGDAKSAKSANSSSNQDSNSSGGSLTSHSKRGGSANDDSKNSNSNNSYSTNQGKDDQAAAGSANTSDFHQPWRQREIVTLYIPVHDTEKAGLGVSVKGKTSAVGGGGGGGVPGAAPSTDLGIFIKNVLHGGAASRDGRLRTNDQLLSVNGISLSGLSNQAAMETLRRAMLRTEGPVEGTIVLTVARRIQGGAGAGAGQLAQDNQRRGSVSSLLTDSSANTETFGAGGGSSRDSSGAGGAGSGGEQQNNSGNSEASDSTVICLPPSAITSSSSSSAANHHNHHQHHHQNSTSSSNNSTNQHQRSNNDGVLMRNAVLERLTGHTSLPGMGNLHNESYYRATHQTTLLSLGANSAANESGKMTSPTVNQPARETLIIEDDTSFLPSGSAGGMLVPTMPKASRTDSSTSSQADATYASQLSLDTGGMAGADTAGFTRDAFGRQSMSEKRHATLDAKNTDTYRRTKRARELRQTTGGATVIARINSAESLARSETEGDADKSQLGPSLGMKKSSSLESLQTMVQEMQMYEERTGGAGAASGTSGGAGAVRVIRGRGCNESFRAAVDRSYDAPLAGGGMDTLTEDGDCDVAALNAMALGGPGPLDRRQTSLDSKLKAKKRQSLLRGIGSMFRFGKHRKSADGGEVGVEGEDGCLGGMESGEEGAEREMARKMARDEQLRIQEQLRRLMMAAQAPLTTNTQTSGVSRESGVDIGGNGPAPVGGGSRTGMTSSGGSDVRAAMTTSGGDVTGGALDNGVSRSERIQQLRAHHQLRHQERRGHYPLEDTEERYELALRQRLEQSPELDNAIHRPGSRVGITDPARFSHYVNYQQIQHHLNMTNEQHPHQHKHMHQQQQQQHHYVEVSHRHPLHHSSTLSVRVIDDNDDNDSRRQQHYHSQRREPSRGGGAGADSSSAQPTRPVSNFYEYESVETRLMSNSNSSNSLPRRPQGGGTAPPPPPPHHQLRHTADNYSAVPGLAHHFRPPHMMSNNNNSLNHNNNNNLNSNHNNNNVRKSHGPFVSHVTIRECQQHQPKV